MKLRKKLRGNAPFIGDDFLLKNETAKILYHGYAEDMPIFDYHCHLSPKEIYEDKTYRSLTEVWLGGDHYKWRLLREAGIEEELITGCASDEDKFRAFASVIPYTIGNPMYAWVHLELKRFFGIDECLCPATAEDIYARANEKLKTMTAREMIKMSHVTTLCTTDDPADSLEYHVKLREDKSFEVRVLPSFRPDKALNIERDTFRPWLAAMEARIGRSVTTLAELKEALRERVDFFDSVGCICSDHAMDKVEYRTVTEEAAAETFRRALAGEAYTAEELEGYKGHLLVFLGRLYNEKRWVQQYHIGALRNNSARAYRALGPDTGYDSIHDEVFAAKLSALMNALDETGELPRTVLYCLNPRDNEVLATMMNCFQGGGIAGKIQFGSGWWFNDQKDGMERQLEALMQVGLVSEFIGMLTDSRSFLSYTRHEYFRRILCNRLGTLIEDGEYPYDLQTVGNIVQNVCYNNATRYFKNTAK